MGSREGAADTPPARRPRVSGEGTARTRALAAEAFAELPTAPPAPAGDPAPAPPAAGRPARRPARATPPAASRPRLAVAVLTGAAALVLLGATLPAMAIPSLHASLGGSAPDARLAVSLYLAAMGAAVPVAAGLGDRIGAARLLRWSLAALTTASVLAGLSWNLGLLLGLRVAQGAAAGLLLPVALALLRRVRPGPARVAGPLGGALLLAPALAPALGAWLAGHLEWRVPPLAMLPLGVASLAGAWISLPAPAGGRGARPDPAGMVTAALALGTLLLALLQGAAWGWSSYAVLGLLCLSLLSTALLAVVELSVPEPLVDPRGPGSREALLVLPPLGLAVAALFAGPLEVPLMLQGAGAGGVQAAITLLLPAALAIGSMAAAVPLGARVGPRWPVAAGLLTTAVATDLLHGVAPSAVPRLVLCSSLRGAGLGLALSPLLAAAVAPTARLGRAAAVTAVSVLLPAAAGAAVLGTALAVPAWSPGSQAAAATLAQRLVLLHGDVRLPLPAGTLLHPVLISAALAALGALLALRLPAGRAPAP